MAALCLCIAADKLAVSVFVILTMACITVIAGGLAPVRYLKLLTIPLAFSFYGNRGDCGGNIANALWRLVY